jgi:DNA-binding Xre family transcriptional regulator
MEHKRLGWELEELLWQRRIKSPAELSRRLKAVGVDMTSVHLSRLTKERPQRLSVDLLEGLSIVLDCTMNDLMPVVGQTVNKKVAEAVQPPALASAPACKPAPPATPAPPVRPVEVEQPLPLEPVPATAVPVQKPAGTLRVAWDGVKRPKAAFPNCLRDDKKE